MISNIIIGSPVMLFYIFAIWLSYGQRASQPKLSTLCMFVFIGKILVWFSSVLMSVMVSSEIGWQVSSSFGMEPKELVLILRKIVPIISLGLDGLLLFCVFAWRKQSGGHYKKPALIAAAVIVSIMALNVLSGTAFAALAEFSFARAQEFQTVFFLMVSCIYAALFLWSLCAVYGWRENNFNNELSYMLALKVDPNTEEEVSGFFQVVDYVPFLVGLFVFGGLIVVPLIWGEIFDFRYSKAIAPALFSCFLFAICHNRRGRFLFKRFLFVIAYISYVLFKITVMNVSSNGGEPFFIAGGLLGYPVMLGCGWLGIVIVRLIKRLVLSVATKGRA